MAEQDPLSAGMQRLIATNLAKPSQSEVVIESGMNLNQALLTAKFVPETDKSTDIQVDVSAALPSPGQVSPDDYIHVKWQIYASTVDKEPAEADKADFTTLSGTERLLQVQNSAFGPAKTVFVRVRMLAIHGGTQYAGEWARAEASRVSIPIVPTLPTPRGVQLSLDPVSNSVLIGLPAVDEPPSDWDIALVDENKQPLFTSTFAAANPGPSVFRIAVADVGYNLPGTKKTAQARVRQRSWDPAQYRDSPMAQSLQTLPLVFGPLGLTTRVTSSHEISATWELDKGFSVSDYTVSVVREETQEKMPVTQSKPTLSGNLVTTVIAFARGVVEGTAVSVLVAAAQNATQPSLNLFAKSTVALRPAKIVEINSSQSNLDLSTSILTLVLDSSTAFNPDASFKVQQSLPRAGETADQPPYLSVKPSHVLGKRAVLRLRLAGTPDATFKVRVVDPDGSRVDGKAAWSLPQINPLDLYIHDARCSVVGEKEKRRVVITWKPFQSEVKDVKVAISVYSETAPTSGRDVMATSLEFGVQDKECTLGPKGELAIFSAGSALVVYLLVKRVDGRVVGQATKLPFVW